MSGMQTVTLEDETYGDPTGSASVSASVTVIDEESGSVTEVEMGSQTVEVDLGVEGPRGENGPTSEPIKYTLAAASSFNAAHNFNWPPEVRFVNAHGEPVNFRITYPDDQHVHVQFPTPFTGVMYLR